MKENKAFRIPFTTKKQLKSRQAMHRIFLKPQYKVYRGASILYFNASFSDVSSFSKMSQPPGQNQQINSIAYHPCPSRLASRLTLTFIRHLTLINSNLIQKKISLFFSMRFKQFHIFIALNYLFDKLLQNWQHCSSKKWLTRYY